MLCFCIAQSIIIIIAANMITSINAKKCKEKTDSYAEIAQKSCFDSENMCDYLQQLS